MSRQGAEALVARLEALAERAMRGPWEVEDTRDGYTLNGDTSDEQEGGCWLTDFGAAGRAEAEFAAVSREAVPGLCAALRQAWARAESLTTTIDETSAILVKRNAALYQLSEREPECACERYDALCREVAGKLADALAAQEAGEP